MIPKITIMSVPNITCKSSQYRVICPLTLEKQDRDSKMEEFINEKNHVNSPVKGLMVVDMQPIDYEKDGKVYYGINYVLVNFIKIMRDFKKTVSYSFFIKFVDNKGDKVDCCITKQYIPYHYYFNCETMSLKPAQL